MKKIETKREEMEENEEYKERKMNKDKNKFSHDICKSVQPPTFSNGIKTKHEMVLSFKKMVKNLFDGELSKK